MDYVFLHGDRLYCLGWYAPKPEKVKRAPDSDEDSDASVYYTPRIQEELYTLRYFSFSTTDPLPTQLIEPTQLDLSFKFSRSKRPSVRASSMSQVPPSVFSAFKHERPGRFEEYTIYTDTWVTPFTINSQTHEIVLSNPEDRASPLLFPGTTGRYRDAVWLNSGYGGKHILIQCSKIEFEYAGDEEIMKRYLCSLDLATYHESTSPPSWRIAPLEITYECEKQIIDRRIDEALGIVVLATQGDFTILHYGQ